MKTVFRFFLAATMLAAVSCAPKAGSVKVISRASDAPVEVFSDSVYFNQLYACAGMKYHFENWAPEDFAKWHAEFYDAMYEKLGLKKIAAQLESYVPKVELKPEIEDLGTFTRQRGVIWTEPAMPLPFVMLTPKNLQGKAPLVLALQGHSKNTELFAGVYKNDAERESGEVGERNVGVQAVERGCIAIVPTSRAFGETRCRKERTKDALSSCDTYLKRDLLVGRTPIGDRVWDVMKVIDWALATLPVREDAIVVTGNSGGGTMTLFAGAMDKRVTYTIPSSYFCTFKGSIGNIYHCACNYIPGILDYGEMYDIAGLTAPRVFRAIHGVKDKIFPIDASREAFRGLQQIYKAAGAPDACSMYEGAEGHRYYKDGIWPFLEGRI